MLSKDCVNCDGLGTFLDPHHGHGFRCSTCNGTGKISVWEQIEQATELKEEDQTCCYGMMVAGNQHSDDCKEKIK